MAYDPYKSLLANASREHLKRSADLNTHLVGNVFLPAIDSQHKKKSLATSSAPLKHLKVIEQCIMAENKREERLAKCTTIKERRIMTKKFQAQRERERELIQVLMLGKYPERLHDIKLLEMDAVAPMTPRQQLNQEVTGLRAKVSTPDRVFRKADVTGGVPKAKPHAHSKFKLPECNGSPGKKADVRAQATASANLSSSGRKAPPSTREPQTGTGESPTRKKRSPLRSARSEHSLRSPKNQVKISSESSTTRTADTSSTSSSQRARSPYISPQRLLSKAARTTTQLSALPSKPAETKILTDAVNSEVDDGAGVLAQQFKDFSVAFQGALGFSEAQRIAMGDDTNVLKAKCEKILAEIATQTTPRLLEHDNGIKKASSRPELPPVNPCVLVGAEHQDASATTPRRPQSVRAIGLTRQAFLESLAKESKNAQARKEATSDSSHSISSARVDAESETSQDEPCPPEGEDKSERRAEEQESTEARKDPLEAVDDENTGAEAEYSEDGDHAAEEEPLSSDADGSDAELETDVAEILFDLVDMVEAAAAEKEKQQAVPSPRTVSPRPRSSMGRTTKYVLRIQSQFRGYRARMAFRLALYEDALSCGVLGAMPGTIQGRSGWYLDPKRLMAYYFVIPDPDGEWEQKFTLRCSRLVLTPYEMQQEVLSKVPPLLQQLDEDE